MKDIVLALGINDLLQIPNQLDPNQITVGYQQIVAQAHAVGLRVIGATITPFGGVAGTTAAQESARQSVNASIRAGGLFDAFVDFDLAVRDPAKPSQLLAVYDSGDHLHPNNSGDNAMANQFDLSVF